MNKRQILLIELGVLSIVILLSWYQGLLGGNSIFTFLSRADEQRKEDEAPPETTGAYRALKRVALTFDDGPDPEYTVKVLEVLKEKNVKATFFLLGKQAELYPDLVKRISEEGHVIGNHAYRHEHLNRLSLGQAAYQVNRANEIIYDLTGAYPLYLRPPFGDWKKKLDTKVNMVYVGWNLDTLDWSSKNHKKIVNKVMTKVKENDIILMHDAYQTTVTATKEIIDKLRKNGYEFVTVDELLFD